MPLSAEWARHPPAAADARKGVAVGEYHPLRRVPEAAPPLLLTRRLAPLVPPLLRSLSWSVLSEVTPGAPVESVPTFRARRASAEFLEKAQDIFFSEPGLDTVFLRQVVRLGLPVVRVSRLESKVLAALPGEGERARELAEHTPARGYDALMLFGLSAGRALGYFKSGHVNTLMWWDGEGKAEALRPGHPRPEVRRFQPPRSLGDLAADIDDLYWAGAYGQPVKITEVGTGSARRWLVSIPGTDHAEVESVPNVADLEANMAEELNLASPMRKGIIKAVHRAMDAAGVAESARAREKVLLVGHSQGGIIAANLAALPPAEVGFEVAGVITLGSPTRRVKIRPEVAMLAVEHVQDIVPSLDGATRRRADQRVVVERSLVRPKYEPLYYAHSSSTYTDTLRQVEDRAGISGWGKEGETVRELRELLPGPGEYTRVTHHYIWQELEDSSPVDLREEYLHLAKASPDPVTYGDEVVVAPSGTPTAKELLAQIEGRLEQLTTRRGGKDPSTQEEPDDEKD